MQVARTLFFTLSIVASMRLSCYSSPMKTTIENMIARVRTWPKDRQEDAARVLETIELEGTTTYTVTDRERAEIEAALQEVDRGELATEVEVTAFKARHNL